jgi:hypothetical protein
VPVNVALGATPEADSCPEASVNAEDSREHRKQGEP